MFDRGRYISIIILFLRVKIHFVSTCRRNRLENKNYIKWNPLCVTYLSGRAITKIYIFIFKAFPFFFFFFSRNLNIRDVFSLFIFLLLEDASYIVLISKAVSSRLPPYNEHTTDQMEKSLGYNSSRLLRV